MKRSAAVRAHSRSRRAVLIALCPLAIILTGAALAWACSPSGFLTASPGAGAVGSTVMVTGTGFTEGATVNIHWDSLDNVLARAVGPTFTVAVTIPNDSPGAHTMFGSVNGEGTSQDPASFEITGSPPSPPAQTATATDGPAGALAQQPAITAAQPATAAPPKTPTARPTTNTKPKPSTTTQTKRPPVTAHKPVARDRSPAPVATRTTPPSNVTGVAQSSGQPVFAGSVARNKSAAPRRAAARKSVATTPRTTEVPAQSSTARTARLPTLTSSTHNAAPQAGPDGRLGIGLAILAFGILLPIAGLMVVEARRRRTKADR